MADAIVKTNEVIGPVKFGFGQLLKSTPEFAKLAFRFILYFATIITFVVQTISEIPQPIKDMVSRYALEVVTIVHFLSKMFGVDVEQPKSVADGKDQ